MWKNQNKWQNMFGCMQHAVRSINTWMTAQFLCFRLFRMLLWILSRTVVTWFEVQLISLNSRVGLNVEGLQPFLTQFPFFRVHSDPCDLYLGVLPGTLDLVKTVCHLYFSLYFRKGYRWIASWAWTGMKRWPLLGHMTVPLCPPTIRCMYSIHLGPLGRQRYWQL